MTEDEAYKVHIQYTFNAFCKVVIRHAAIDIILKLRRRWEREVSLDYLMNEKFVQLAIQLAPPPPLDFFLIEAIFRSPHYRKAPALTQPRRRPCPFARADTGRNFPLLFPAPAAAGDRRTYRTDTQHSRAAYPACLEAAPAAHGGKTL